jgi:hypothetical protein
MRAKWPDIVAAGAAIGWFMMQLFARDHRLKTALKWVFGVTVVGAVIVALWPTENAPKPTQSLTQKTTGDHSPILNAGNINYTDMTINQPAPNLLKQQLQRLCQDLNQLASECDKCTTNDIELLALPSGN